MGAIDAKRQAPNVDRIRRLGAELLQVTKGDQTLRSAIDEALRDWVSDPESTYYMLGSAVGPHPYPWLVCQLQSVIGREARAQILEQEGRLPDLAVACVGGGSNAIGLFHPLLEDRQIEMLGIEAGGTGEAHGLNAATLHFGTAGVLHGSYSILLQNKHGQIKETHSLSAGLDYPGVGPEHAFLDSIGRVKYKTVSDDEAVAAVDECCALEGILPALESAHALAGAKRWAVGRQDSCILIGLSGRGDKDLATLMSHHQGDRS
jgi:tryptophan synthase beta chain